MNDVQSILVDAGLGKDKQVILNYPTVHPCLLLTQ